MSLVKHPSSVSRLCVLLAYACITCNVIARRTDRGSVHGRHDESTLSTTDRSNAHSRTAPGSAQFGIDRKSKQRTQLDTIITNVAGELFNDPTLRFSSPLASLPEYMTVSLVATFPLSASKKCMDAVRVYADNIVYSGLRDAARSILVVLAIASVDNAHVLTEAASYLQARFPSSQINVHSYDHLQSAGAHALWKQSVSMSISDAKNHVFLYSGFSAYNDILDVQMASDVHVASSIIWPWKSIVKTFQNNSGIGKAGYACDSTGTLLFHHFWIRAQFVAQLLPEPTLSTLAEFFRHWLEIAAEVAGVETTVGMTLSNCRGNAAPKPGLCTNDDVSGEATAYPMSVIYDCMCPQPDTRSSDEKMLLDALDVHQVAALCNERQTKLTVY